MHDRSLCLPPHTPTKTVCQLETGSERGAQRRLHDGLVESEGICFPSVQLNSVSSSEGQEGTRDSDASGTTMDHTTLVASTDRTYCGLPGISGEQPQTTARRVQSRSDAPSFSISEVSRNVTKQWEFHKKLSNSSATTPRAQPPKHTMFPGLSGVAGVRRGKVIPYHVQCLTF